MRPNDIMYFVVVVNYTARDLEPVIPLCFKSNQHASSADSNWNTRTECFLCACMACAYASLFPWSFVCWFAGMSVCMYVCVCV